MKAESKDKTHGETSDGSRSAPVKAVLSASTRPTVSIAYHLTSAESALNDLPSDGWEYLSCRKGENTIVAWGHVKIVGVILHPAVRERAVPVQAQSHCLCVIPHALRPPSTASFEILGMSLRGALGVQK